MRQIDAEVLVIKRPVFIRYTPGHILARLSWDVLDAVLQKENQQLKDELGGLRTQNASQEENLATLKQQVDVLKYSSATMNEEEKKQFERRLTVYVKEIDKCIAMLSA